MAKDPANPDFSLADGNGYMLDRGHAAACRLNLQFYLWKAAMKFNIHPSIPIPKDAVIADVATGTGMWLIDVSHDLPTARLDGLDIDLTQAPHRQWLPPNIKLRQWNIFDEVPSDLVGKYDILHVRLLLLVIEQGDPRPVIRNFLKMLKPGGYLQWDDLNFLEMCVKKVDPQLQVPALEQLREMVSANGRGDWVLQLPEYATEEGFEDTNLYYFGDGNELARAFNEQHLLTMEEFALSLTKIGKKEEALRFYKIIRDSCQESLKGAGLCIPRVVCVGRKAY
ncbi:hypothetical protein MMC28_003674 [Mycoblastus sanguinarius]|nr:hypothetical protein [Mycoblastus sanguinarius]